MKAEGIWDAELLGNIDHFEFSMEVPGHLDHSDISEDVFISYGSCKSVPLSHTLVA